MSVLEFTWITETGLVMRVRYEITPDGAESVLVMRHSALSTTSAPHRAAGWHAMLDRLAAHLGGGEVDWDGIFAEVQPGYVARFSDPASAGTATSSEPALPPR